MNLKNEIIQNFEYLKNLQDVRMDLLYRKWKYLNDKTWNISELTRLDRMKDSLWYPEHTDDYLKIKPGIRFAKGKADSETWNMMCNFMSLMVWNQSVGRILRCFVLDENTNKILGVLCLASDFIALSPRDSYIGWTFDNRTKDRKINYTAMGSRIVPSQPLGFNYLGGKLMSLLICSDEVVDRWNKIYKDETLVGITTTSLFGGYSQYSNLKYWKNCHTTKGEIPLEPSDDVFQKIKVWMKRNYPAEYRKIHTKHAHKTHIVTRPKGKVLAFTFQKLGITPPIGQQPRGVYFCRLWNDTNEFLRGEIPMVTEPRFDNSVERLVDIWKNKYARKRIKSKPNFAEPLFYDDMIGTTWEETKKKYLGD